MIKSLIEQKKNDQKVIPRRVLHKGRIWDIEDPDSHVPIVGAWYQVDLWVSEEQEQKPDT